MNLGGKRTGTVPPCPPVPSPIPGALERPQGGVSFPEVRSPPPPRPPPSAVSIFPFMRNIRESVTFLIAK